MKTLRKESKGIIAINKFIQHMKNFKTANMKPAKSTSKTSKKKNLKTCTVPEAIQNLRETEAILTKKQELLESKIIYEIQQAKHHAKNNKTLALQALRRKKRYELYLQKVDGTLATIELQRETLESSQTDKAVFDSIKVASEALKQMHRKMDVDEVHNLMDDFAEEREKADEITDAISKPVGFGGVDVDEDELLDELENLEQDEVDRQMLSLELPSTSRALPVPEAGTSEGKKAKKEKMAMTVEEEEELAAIESWAN